jgi:hypothetical protein
VLRVAAHKGDRSDCGIFIDSELSSNQMRKKEDSYSQHTRYQSTSENNHTQKIFIGPRGNVYKNIRIFCAADVLWSKSHRTPTGRFYICVTHAGAAWCRVQGGKLDNCPLGRQASVPSAGRWSEGHRSALIPGRAFSQTIKPLSQQFNRIKAVAAAGWRPFPPRARPFSRPSRRNDTPDPSFETVEGSGCV